MTTYTFTSAAAILALAVQALSPPPQLTVSEWASRYRVLSREDSAAPGQWSHEDRPYQQGIMDAVSDPRIEQVTVCGGAQWGIAHRLQGSPQAGAAQARQRRHAAQRHQPKQRVESALPRRLHQAQADQAVVAPGQANPLAGQRPQHLRRRQREHGQVDTGAAHQHAP